jgi:predicted nucleic acid-binding protein
MGGGHMAKPRRGGIVTSVVLDAQALSKLAAGDEDMRALYLEASRRDGKVRLFTAASTLAEVLRGGPRDAAVHRVLTAIHVADVTQQVGRKAGELLGATGMSGHRCALDALLAAVALAQDRPVVLATSDPGDLTRLTEEPDRDKRNRIAVIAV